MSWLKVCEAFKSSVGQPVTIKGWVRTNRESKADGGLCFVAVSDGTAFDAIQAVCRGNLANFAEIQKLNTGCAVEITGQPGEQQAAHVRVPA
jgi:asparaginyl-tRNA synthetase